MGSPVVALTSGRFDPPHPGHIMNIIELAKRYDEVRVVILDYLGRRYPVCYCIDIFKKIFAETNLKVEFFVNSTHFANVTKTEIDEYSCDLYSGEISKSFLILRGWV